MPESRSRRFNARFKIKDFGDDQTSKDESYWKGDQRISREKEKGNRRRDQSDSEEDRRREWRSERRTQETKKIIEISNFKKITHSHVVQSRLEENR